MRRDAHRKAIRKVPVTDPEKVSGPSRLHCSPKGRSGKHIAKDSHFFMNSLQRGEEGVVSQINRLFNFYIIRLTGQELPFAFIKGAMHLAYRKDYFF